MESWLRCRVSAGMLPTEYTVVTTTSEGKLISMFAPESFVSPEKGLIRVTVLDMTRHPPGTQAKNTEP